MASILLVSILLGTAANLIPAHHIPWIGDWANYVKSQAATDGLQVIDLPRTRTLIAAGTHLVFDARAIASYDAGHLPGALSFPVDDFATLYPQYAPLLDPSTLILVYCSGEECDESLLLGKQLRDHGHTNISLFPGGYSAWSASETTGGAP